MLTRHLERMTDDTGLLEHAMGIIPRRKEGYTTDDNARALWACMEWMSHTAAGERQAWESLADIYLSFLLWAQNEDGTFHNNYAYDRTREKESPSDDCFGRSVWAAAAVWVCDHSHDRRLAAEQILDASAKQAFSLKYPRGWAYTLSAFASVLNARDCVSLLGDREEWLSRLQAREIVLQLQDRLLEQYRRESRPGWSWFESELTYGNGVLPWALFNAYRISERKEVLDAAQASFRFLADRMTAPEGWIRPVGNEDWGSPEYMSQWDQQPLEVMKLALAARESWRVLGSQDGPDIIRRCHEWFYGKNDCGVPLADETDGSCCDGLTAQGPNRNRGAESTLAYLLTEAIYTEVFHNSLPGICCMTSGKTNFRA